MDPEDTRLHHQFECLEAEDGVLHDLNRDAAGAIVVELTRPQQYGNLSRQQKQNDKTWVFGVSFCRL